MKTLFIQMAADGKLILNNIFFRITIGFLVLIILTVHFILPKGAANASVKIVQFGMGLVGLPEADSIVELEEFVRADENVIGVYEQNGELAVLVNNLSEKQARAALGQISPREDGVPIRFSHTSQITQPAPFHMRMVPMMISVEAVMTGILLAGVLTLNEKERMITRAYRVSPAGALSYVASKTVLFSLVGAAYSFLIAVFTVGFDIHIGPFLLLSFIVSALFTLMGMAVTVFLKSLTSWLLWMAFVIGTNTVVLFAYIFPSVPMDYMKLLPAYPMIFAYEWTMFGLGGYAGNGLEILALWAVALFAVCLMCVKFRLLRPHRGE